jgi:hypothetical protein
MTDIELTRQIVTAAKKAALRIDTALTVPENIQKAYLDGISQMAFLLVRLDGELSPQQIERCVVMGGASLGFISGPPDNKS